MFTDIVGYSALTHRDELLALRLVEEHRLLLRPIFSQHSGREIRTIGDAFFVEFASAVDAVKCGIEIQKALAGRNHGELRKSRQLLVRIGIHLGDVIEAEDGSYDIYGDGVNIAARLQFLAHPGGLCFSSSVHDQIRNKIDQKPTRIGARKLKNIPTPVEIYRLDPGLPSSTLRFAKPARSHWVAAIASASLVLGVWTGAPLLSKLGTHAGQGSIEMTPGKFRVAVLPFASITDGSSAENSDDEYLSDGMTEEMISNLSRIQGLGVLARGSIMQYKQNPKPTPIISRELGVSALVQGTVRKSGQEMRVTIQLIDTKTQETFWSEGFDGKLDDVFQLQKSIAQKVTEQFQKSLRGGRSLASIPQIGSNASEEARSIAGPTPDKDAYLLYLRGKHLIYRRTEASLWKAFDYFNQAIKLDPGYPGHHVAAASTLHILTYYGYLSPKESLARERPYTEKALNLSGESSEALTLRAGRRLYYDLDWDGAEQDYRRAIALAPGSHTTHQHFANLLTARGRFDEASREYRLAFEEDPLSASMATSIGIPDYFRGRFDPAIRQFESALQIEPEYVPAMVWMARSWIEKREFPRAIVLLEKASRLSGGAPMVAGALGYAYARAGKTEEARSVLTLLDIASRDRYVSNYYPASIHLALGEKERALALLELAIEERSVNLVDFKIDPALRDLRSDQRFIAMLQSLGFTR